MFQKANQKLLEHAKCPRHSRKLATKTAFTCLYRYFFEKVLMVFLTPLVYTPPNSEIVCAQNVGTKVVCGIIFFLMKRIYAENLRKIVGAL